jgi:hypothetical protein
MQEVPLFPLWVTVFLTIWVPIGPLMGIVVGHYLTRSWQHRQWIADNQKEEYKNLLGGFNRLNMAISMYQVTGTGSLADLKLAMGEISSAANTTLFITEFLETTKVIGDLLDASEKLMKGGSFEEYRLHYWKAVNQILEAAKKIKM